MRALVLSESDGRVTSKVRALDEGELPAGDVRVAVEYSSLNYKDGMVIRGLGKLVRRYPHVPGIDLAGVVERSSDERFRPGDRVVCTGYRVGELRWGGYATHASLSGDWLLPLPMGLTSRRAMAIGTAGLAAMLAVRRLVSVSALKAAAGGEVLVTGASGGVGSFAVMLLAGAGYRVTASTGRSELHEYLRLLGAAALIDRSELAEPPTRPLDAARWDGCVDNVGSTTLARVLTQMKPDGAVAAVGLAGGNELNTTVLPFLLRGVSLLGVDTNDAAIGVKRSLWADVAERVPADRLDGITTVEPLGRLPELADEILAGRVRGRVVIDVNA